MTDTPKWLVVVQKVTNIGSGESIQVSTNLSQASTKEDLLAAIQEILWALEERLIQQNEKVIAITEATKAAVSGLLDKSVN